MIFRAPQLLARNPGPHRCWFCGADCDDEHRAADHVKSNNTVRQYVAAPNSEYVCAGCVEAHSERADFLLYDGTAVEGKRRRGYAWYATESAALAYPLSRRYDLGDRLVQHEHEAPWAATVPTSGQKHSLYLAPVNRPDSHVCEVTLEDEVISYSVDQLRDRRSLTIRLAAITGRPALESEPGIHLYRHCYEQLGSTDLAELWATIWAEPISRLAVALTPSKEICRERLESASAGAD